MCMHSLLSEMQGSVLLSHSVKNPTCCWEFEAEVFLLYVAGTPIKVGFQATVYIGSTMQNAVVKEVMKKASVCIHVCNSYKPGKRSIVDI